MAPRRGRQGPSADDGDEQDGAGVPLPVLACVVAVGLACGSALARVLGSHSRDDGPELSQNVSQNVSDGPEVNQNGSVQIVLVPENGSLELPEGIEVVDAWWRSLHGGFKVSVRRLVQEQCDSGNPVVHASELNLFGTAFMRGTKELNITYKKLGAPWSRPLATSPRALSPPGVTVLAQIGDPDLWLHLKLCMVNVSRVMEAESHGFNVFLAFHHGVDDADIFEVEQDARSTFGQNRVRSITVESKGAEIGPYLRQLQVLGRDSPDMHYDMLLKIHTRSSRRVRDDGLRHLCGELEHIRQLYTRMRQSKSIGMVGPKETVFVPPWVHTQEGAGARRDPARVIGEEGEELESLRMTWKMMQPLVPFHVPFREAHVIAGSLYWARQDAVLYDIILRSVDKLVQLMPHEADSAGPVSHALEVLLPTMAVAVQGLEVRTVDGVGAVASATRSEWLKALWLKASGLL